MKELGMVGSITYELLLEACQPGGASVLTSVTNLAPAGGWHCGVAPAKFVSGRDSTFAYEKRYVDGEAVDTVVIDSKQSQLNRIEAPLAAGIREDVSPLNDIPHMEVAYGERTFLDLELPHRAFDGHFRAGTVNDEPTTDSKTYRAARDANNADARALLELSPVSLVFGSWDSSRKSNQGRYRSALVGEIVGVLADQSGEATKPSGQPKRGGARVDPVGMSVQLDGPTLKSILAQQESEMSGKTVDKIRKEADKAKTKPVSASPLGLGGIPPSLEQLGVVACQRIIRTHVLSFAALRQLRFGSSSEGNAACRALLAALALNGLARSDAELYLRANCDLVEEGAPVVSLDRRHGEREELQSLSIAEADSLLEEATSRAVAAAEIVWNGKALSVVGNPVVMAGALEDAEGE